MKTIVMFLSVAVVALATPQGGYDTPGSGGQVSGGQGSGGQGSPSASAPASYGGQGSGRPGGQFVYPPAQYNFQWDVNDSPSGNFYGHEEQRDGDNTQGSYYVQLPDGRRQLVEYFVDQFGYHPTVTYEGEATFPAGGGGGGGGGGGSQEGYYQ
ncbi:pro-resilin-like [Homarus americanus]|uniref:pro-resilin-like n=1 Tax=Homarus americanus TaxID=6706 RepID=UPI001C48E249|nr:pro-resilin-like [Homarus americanus]